MRFCNGEREGKPRHHDIALVEGPVAPAGHPRALNHVAAEYATLAV